MLKSRTHLIIAAVFWAIAGINIAIIGIRSALTVHLWWVYLAAIPVFLVFRYAIFDPVARKYAKRIVSFPDERTVVYKVFSVQGYLVMIFMIALGVTLRVGHLVPLWSIAFFYLGLGLALLVASWVYVSAFRSN